LLLENYEFEPAVSTINNQSVKEMARAGLLKIYHQLFGVYNVVQIKDVLRRSTQPVARPSHSEKH
jgi:hypothetical protein